MLAPVLARNHASVGPAMPAPLIRTRMAKLQCGREREEKVRTLRDREDGCRVPEASIAIIK